MFVCWQLSLEFVAMAILFAVVARGTTILAKHAWCGGNFLEVTEQILAKIPSENNKLTYSHGRYVWFMNSGLKIVSHRVIEINVMTVSESPISNYTQFCSFIVNDLNYSHRCGSIQYTFTLHIYFTIYTLCYLYILLIVLREKETADPSTLHYKS